MATPISSPYASGWIFAFRPRKVVETFWIHQNVRNGHVYIRLMKQHILQNAYFLRYSRKTVFLMPPEQKNSDFDINARITTVRVRIAVPCPSREEVCKKLFARTICKNAWLKRTRALSYRRAFEISFLHLTQ